MSFEQESGASEPTSPSWQPTAGGTPPPPPAGGPPVHFAHDDGEGSDPQAAAERGALFAHWAADDGPPAAQVIDKLESRLAALPGGDVTTRLEQLDASGAQHKAEATHEPE